VLPPAPESDTTAMVKVPLPPGASTHRNAHPIFHVAPAVKPGNVDGPLPVVFAMSNDRGAVVAVADGSDEGVVELDGSVGVERASVVTVVSAGRGATVGVGEEPPRLIKALASPLDFDGFLPE
jgi:hypothetical protein